MKRIITISALVLTIAFTVSIGSFASATSLDYYYQTIVSEAGWKLRSDKYHMGSKSFEYQLSSGAISKGYEDYIEGAIDAWNLFTYGNNKRMKLNKVNSTNEGHFTTTPDYVDYKITRYHVSNSEVYEWSISLGGYTYQILSDPSQVNISTVKKIIEKSLGYVYGLDKIAYSESVMCSTGYTSIRQWDFIGLEVVTHAHKHMDDFTDSELLTYSNINHRYRCSYCKGFYTIPHTFTGPHAGYYTCSVCGYATASLPSTLFNTIDRTV